MKLIRLVRVTPDLDDHAYHTFKIIEEREDEYLPYTVDLDRDTWQVHEFTCADAIWNEVSLSMHIEVCATIGGSDIRTYCQVIRINCIKGFNNDCYFVSANYLNALCQAHFCCADLDTKCDCGL